MIYSRVKCIGYIELPFLLGEFSMIPFNLNTLNGLSDKFKFMVINMLNGITHDGGEAYLTVHGKNLKQGKTLRRGGPHTDGN